MGSTYSRDGELVAPKVVLCKRCYPRGLAPASAGLSADYPRGIQKHVFFKMCIDFCSVWQTFNGKLSINNLRRKGGSEEMVWERRAAMGNIPIQDAMTGEVHTRPSSSNYPRTISGWAPSTCEHVLKNCRRDHHALPSPDS